MNEQHAPRRRVRSFVRRAGRLTRGQQRALERLWPVWGIDAPRGELALDEIFARQAPRVVEIGYGDGETLVEMAAHQPAQDFIGIEVHPPGIGHCLLAIERAGIGNLRLIDADAVDVLARWLPPASVARVNLFFPDPWPKKRHHKRRLVQPAFVPLLARVLAAGGLFHVATDWGPYAEQIDAVIGAAGEFEPAKPPADRPRSRFERRGMRLGHAVTERAWRKRAARS